ncbi:Synaptobrevin domain-containing protein [Rozella allomycis CSF55]|uniref:Synaptobrevin domain-containing protein n=1 Tax=Rozella allomycis (strain CSF55) TaxID=988480 RepID=A0A075AS41_ROZAC|nr:Synaptobrevin domain-containing protein [Rozella allomycis CSF55]|eukprot:EPZ31373.1 Synaptobrevin domain-containing protein [Rozella allomycis CSF55]
MYGNVVEAKSTLLPYSLSEFSNILNDRMKYFNTNGDYDKMNNVKGEIDQVKDIMVKRVLERGERIELLVDKTDHLSQSALTFQRRAKKVKRSFWWSNMRLAVILVFLLILLAYIGTSYFCGFDFDKCMNK